MKSKLHLIEQLQSHLSGDGHSCVIPKDLVRRCIGIITDQEKVEQFHKESLKRIAAEFGIVHPIQMMVKAENNEETYVDILVKIIRERLAVA